MKKKIKSFAVLMTVCAIFSGLSQSVYATEENDDVVIEKSDKPYLSLGEDLTSKQREKVLGLMGIDESKLDSYDVVYVNNKEEHKYLDEYISSSEIGTKSLSSVVITKGDSGSGLSISTYNINYCTVGMYKNALATAGVTDAKIIVAGPTPISGTAALVGTFKAYEEMTGEELDEEVVDASLDELVTTGELNESIDGDSQSVEAMIADLKAQLGDGSISTRDEIVAAIEETAEKYDLKLSEEDIDKLVNLLMKLKNIDVDWDSISEQASDWASMIGEKIEESGILSIIGDFFCAIWEAICDFFIAIWEFIKNIFM